MHLLVIQHVTPEHLGAFADHFESAGARLTTIDFSQGDVLPGTLDGFDGMVVLGGPMDVWQRDEFPWLADEIAAIRCFVTQLGQPFLGLCLGHQLLAAALGAPVGLASGSEVGIHRVALTQDAAHDPLLAGLPADLAVFQWHSAEVRSLPAGAVALARSSACEIQAFRFGSSAWGFQFHPEVGPAMVDAWGAMPDYARSLQEARGDDGPETVRAEVVAAGADLAHLAEHIATRWIAAVNEKR